MFYSATKNAFYLPEKEADYKAQNVWPYDAVLVSDEVASEFIAAPPAGQQRIAGEDGQPCWADIPPLTQEEYQALAEDEKQRRIAAANAYINSQQWPSRLTLRESNVYGMAGLSGRAHRYRHGNRAGYRVARKAGVTEAGAGPLFYAVVVPARSQPS